MIIIILYYILLYIAFVCLKVLFEITYNIQHQSIKIENGNVYLTMCRYEMI